MEELFQLWCTLQYTNSPINYPEVSTSLLIQRKTDDLIKLTRYFYKSLHVNITKTWRATNRLRFISSFTNKSSCCFEPNLMGLKTPRDQKTTALDNMPRPK